MVRSQALCTLAATSGWLMCTSISTAPSRRPEGLARFWPARRGAEPARGVGEVLAGSARGGAVDGLEHGATLADVGRPGEAHGAGDLSRHVAEDIAVQVGHDDDVERGGRVGQLGGTWRITRPRS